jgi:hypothetical protein
MEELKKKQASAQKDRAAAAATDIRHIIHRPPVVPSFVGPGTGKRRFELFSKAVSFPGFNRIKILLISSLGKPLGLHYKTSCDGN